MDTRSIIELYIWSSVRQKGWVIHPQRYFLFLTKKLGNELSRVVIDLTVTNVDPLNTKHDGVYLIVVNLSEMDSDMIKYTDE